jgi:hypothetical protein
MSGSCSLSALSEKPWDTSRLKGPWRSRVDPINRRVKGLAYVLELARVRAGVERVSWFVRLHVATTWLEFPSTHHFAYRLWKQSQNSSQRRSVHSSPSLVSQRGFHIYLSTPAPVENARQLVSRSATTKQYWLLTSAVLRDSSLGAMRTTPPYSLWSLVLLNGSRPVNKCLR